jgi:hypothetical protein
MRRVGGALIGLALTVMTAAPVAAQHWPGYGDYGYGSGFDYQRNVYSYPRMAGTVTTAMPQDSLAIYGGYMPNTYYSGAAYLPERSLAFNSGQAYCQTAGSFLYCADIEGGMASLLSAGRNSEELRAAIGSLPLRQGSQSVFSGVLATRAVGSTASLVGTLSSPDGSELPVNCSGPLSTNTSRLSCR